MDLLLIIIVVGVIFIISFLASIDCVEPSEKESQHTDYDLIPEKIPQTTTSSYSMYYNTSRSWKPATNYPESQANSIKNRRTAEKSKNANQMSWESNKSSISMIHSKQKHAYKEKERFSQMGDQKSKIGKPEKLTSKSYQKPSSTFGQDSRKDRHQKKVELCAYHGKPVYKEKSGYCYGYFKCGCGRTWRSGYCRVGYEQKCQSCGTKVYAYCMHYKMISETRSDSTKPHLRNLSGKSQALGSPCYNINHQDPVDFESYKALRPNNDNYQAYDSDEDYYLDYRYAYAVENNYDPDDPDYHASDYE